MATARYGVYGSGTQAASVVMGGFLNGPNAVTAATEEWTGEVATANSKTLTTS
jgi:hypothetical protein